MEMETQSLWKDTAKGRGDFPALHENLKADIAVIGGGITGLTTAYLLQKAGKKVVLIEALNIGDGTTGFSSCHLNTDLDFEYRNLISSFDKDRAKLVAQSRIKGIDFIESFINQYSIDCDFRRVPGYLYTEQAEEIQNLKEELEAAGSSGLQVTLVDTAPLPFKNLQALRFEHQAQFNAQKYIEGMAEVLASTSCQIFENSRVLNIIENDDYCLVGTATGSVTCQKVVVATHLPLLFNILQTMAAPYRSYVIAAKLTDNAYPEGLFWDTEDPYHYTKTYISGNEKWLVVGGKDHKTGEVVKTEDNFEQLENYLRERYNVESITHRWSAQYYEPVDGLPYIGKNPFSKNTFVATGFSGDGLVYGTIAAMLITDLIEQKENQWLKAYDATRFTPMASAHEFLKENADVVKHFIKDRFTVQGKDFEAVKPGEGKIVELNGEKLAVARDTNDVLHVLSPVCPHMKCFVQWNGSEKSWDCPCHGSRFSINGEVIYGPAVKDLENKMAQQKS